MTGDAVGFDEFATVFAEFFDRTPDEVGRPVVLADLAFDSVEMLEVLLFLEDAADHEVPEEVLTPGCTVGDIYDLYVTYLGHSG